MASQSSQISSRFMVSTEEWKENKMHLFIWKCFLQIPFMYNIAILFKGKNQKSKRNVMMATIKNVNFKVSGRANREK